MAQGASPHIIVIGNEKGGSGKSTTAMHVIVGLLKQGRRVGALDLDARQGTLSRYMQNRIAMRALAGPSIRMPAFEAIPQDQIARLSPALEAMAPDCEVIVIDCPGSDTALSRHAHILADTLITPINDSFIDFDVLGRVDPETLTVVKPSHYAEMVWDQRKRRALERLPPIDWIVMRNRLSQTDARNKQMVATAMEALAKRIGFRIAPGFGERVIFRELFLKGLTLLDLGEGGVGGTLSVSHVAARNEVRMLLATLNLPVAG